jgi:hypothetical protein
VLSVITGELTVAEAARRRWIEAESNNTIEMHSPLMGEGPSIWWVPDHKIRSIRARSCRRRAGTPVDSIPRPWATLVEPLSRVLHAPDRIGPIRPAQSALVIGAGTTGAAGHRA